MTLPARSRRWSYWLLGFYTVSVYLFLYIPIVILMLFSFNQSKFGANWTGWTLDWYRELFQDERLGSALKTSLLIALISTLAATLMGTMLALALERYRFRGRSTLDGVSYLPIVMPDIVMAVSLLVFFSFIFRLANQGLGLELRNGIATVIISHSLFNIPFVTVIVRASLRNFDRRIEEAASDLGATPWRTFRYITFPLIAPGILAGALIAFTLSLDDFIITFFTSGPGLTTLPLEVYSRVRRTITPVINAVSTLMLLASVGLISVALLLQRRRM